MSSWGLKGSNDNKDVLNVTDVKDLAFTSGKGMLGLRQAIVYSDVTDLNGEINVLNNHNFGYIPIVFVESVSWDNKRVKIPNEWHSFYINSYRETIEITEYFNYHISKNQFRMMIKSQYFNYDTFASGNNSGITYQFKVRYLFNENTDTI